MTEEVTGTPWSDEEVSLCVSAYVEHFKLDISGQRFNKAALYRQLSEATGRSAKSVELKFQNISAVLDELGLCWISGLAPMRNYQRALAEAISGHVPELIRSTQPQSPVGFSDLAALYLEAPPERAAMAAPLPDYVERLVQKFDPVERDMRNRSLGMAGEELAFQYEKRRLEAADRGDLARNVRWISREEGDGAGYDILSYTPWGEKKFVEVKTTVGGNRTPFFVSRNEHRFASANADRFHLFRVYDYARTPRAFEFNGALEKFVRLSPESFRADFKG